MRNSPARIEPSSGIAYHPLVLKDNKNVPGFYRIKKPWCFESRSYLRHNFGDLATANAFAAKVESNPEVLRDFLEGQQPLRDAIADTDMQCQVKDFIRYREKKKPGCIGKAKWRQSCGALNHFAESIGSLPVTQIDYTLNLEPWWLDLTQDAQKNRRSVFKEFFTWLDNHGLVPLLKSNPFIDTGDGCFLEYSQKTTERRDRLGLDGFWIIYDKAGELGEKWFQRAMLISLHTTLRRADIAAMKLSQLKDGILEVTVEKSRNQRGEVNASRIRFHMEHYPVVHEILKQARKDSMSTFFGCKSVVARLPQGKMGDKKEHFCEVLPDYLTKTFTRIRRLVTMPEDQQTATFHEIRSLGSFLLGKSGHDRKLVSELMAHTDEEMTRHYQEHGRVNWFEAQLGIQPELLSRA